MPKLLLPIEETNDSILRPVVYEIARAIMRKTGMPEDTRIYYPGAFETTAQWGSDIGGEKDEPTLFNHGNRLTIEVEETFPEETLLEVAAYRPDNPHIYRDDKLDASIRPVYASSEVTIRFSFRATGKNAAMRWRDLCHAKTATLRQQFLFTVSYHYPISQTMISIVETIYKLRESVGAYGETFQEYFDAHRTPRLTKLVTTGNTSPTWAVPETQQRIQGWFDFTGLPEQGSRDGEANTWTIAFEFKFRYDKPMSLYMRYPIVVHNQPMPATLLPEAKDLPNRRPEEYARYSSSSLKSLGNFECDMWYGKLPYNKGVSIPEFDEFIPETIPTNTLRFYTTLVQVSSQDLRDVMNLTTVPGITIASNIIAFMKRESRYMTGIETSFFSVALYDGIRQLPPSAITVDSELNVRTTFDMDLRKVYHLRLGVQHKWGDLPKDVIDRGKENGKDIIDIGTAIDPTVPKDVVDDLIDNYLPSIGVDKIIGNQNNTYGMLNGMWCMQTLTVETNNA